MPRPRHPIREHFSEIPALERKNGAISCNYCGKELSAGNPKRCQKHLDECTQYTAILSVLDNGGDANISALSSPPEGSSGPATPAQGQNQYYQGAVRTPQHDAMQANNFAASQGQNMSMDMSLQSPQNRAISEEHVMRVLNINDPTYLAIERELDTQLQHLNISGAGLHTSSGRTLLKQAFYQVHQRWPDVFNHAHEHEKTQALTAMAIICNKKRRNGAPPSAGPVTPITVNKPRTGTPGSSASNFGAITILAERADGNNNFVVCRPSDLVEQMMPVENITVNHVKFMPFVSLLQQDDDVMFNPEQDKIVFTFAGGRSKTVSNEVVWRVALEEMHKKEMDPFVFRIFKRNTPT